MGSADLESVLKGLWPFDPESLPEGRRHIADVLKDVLTALDGDQVHYVLAGTMAYSLYARARYTTNVEIIVERGWTKKIKEVCAGLGFDLVLTDECQMDFVDPVTQVELRIRVATVLLEHLAVKNCEMHSIFDVPTPALKPEYLVGLYAQSSTIQDFSDAATLMTEFPVDIPAVRQLLDDANDAAAVERFDCILEAADRGRNSSYSERVEARLRAQRARPRRQRVPSVRDLPKG
jgi:hypothetical protein